MRFYFNGTQTFELQPTYYDKISIDAIPEFPNFNMRVETQDGVLEYTAGNFDIRLFVDSPEVSVRGDKILPFLSTPTPCKFLIVAYFSDTCYFHGFFTTGDKSGAFTYTKGDLHLDITVEASLREFADSYSQPNQGTRTLNISQTFTLENYIPYHFDTNLVLSHRFPAQTYRDRVGDSSVVFAGAVQGRIGQFTNWTGIPRWETYKQLAKGVGMNYKLELESPSGFITQRPDFLLRHFFLTDSTPEITLNVIEHNDAIEINTKSYVYISYRQHINSFIIVNPINPALNQVYSGTQINGILFGQDEVISTDSNDFNPSEFFFITGNDENTLMYVTNSPTQIQKQINRETKVIGIPLEFYSNPAFDKFRQGVMTYASCLVATGFNHTPIQEYMIYVYRRYLLGTKKIKKLVVTFTGQEGIDLYQRFRLDDGLTDSYYYISEISRIDIRNKTAEITGVEI